MFDGSCSLQILKSARQHGDFLLVGIYADQTVRYDLFALRIAPNLTLIIMYYILS